jgi:hypothetical protein
MSPVTDSSTATWGLVITGGGAAHVLASYCDDARISWYLSARKADSQTKSCPVYADSAAIWNPRANDAMGAPNVRRKYTPRTRQAYNQSEVVNGMAMENKLSTRGIVSQFNLPVSKSEAVSSASCSHIPGPCRNIQLSSLPKTTFWRHETSASTCAQLSRETEAAPSCRTKFRTPKVSVCTNWTVAAK